VKVLVLAGAISDKWVVASFHGPCSSCLWTSASITVTATESGQQMGSMIRWIVFVFVQCSLPVLLEVLEAMMCTYVSAELGVKHPWIKSLSKT